MRAVWSLFGPILQVHGSKIMSWPTVLVSIQKWELLGRLDSLELISIGHDAKDTHLPTERIYSSCRLFIHGLRHVEYFLCNLVKSDLILFSTVK